MWPRGPISTKSLPHAPAQERANEISAYGSSVLATTVVEKASVDMGTGEKPIDRAAG